MADYYELLGIAPTASAADVRQAYLKLARELHPDRFPDPVEKATAQTRFTLVSEAFNTLNNERNRRDYDSNRNQPVMRTPQETAQLAFERGQQALDGKQYHDAVELFRTAVNHAPEEPRYLAGLARALSKNPHWSREAIQTMEKAIQLAPRAAVLHAELAAMLAGQNLKLRARREADTARQLAAGNADVERILAPLTLDDEPPPPGDEGGGGLRGLLRRKS